MIVYHSSYTIVDKPDVLHSRDALDFGKGFYVTLLREQAENVKVFNEYDSEWLDFITANREMQQVEKFDAIEGGVANDKIFRTVELYFAGDISKDEALKRLKFERPNHQICFLNQQMIDKNLIYLKSEGM